MALFSAVICAQEFRATISGIVTDATGAPVPGARVVVTSEERQVAFEAESNDAGRYLTRFLQPGRYQLSAEKAGFKKFVREGLVLSATDRLSVNINLEVGTTTDSITVTSEIPALDTETASRSAVLEQKFVDDLPTSGRNMYQLLFSQPGVIKTSRYWGNFELYAYGNMNSISINGGRSGENETLIDGIASTRGDRGTTFAPALNAIAEVAVQSNPYDSQYGRMGGGVTSVALKSGTNAFHAQLFEFFKNDNLNASGYSRRGFGVAKPEYKNNTFGFTVDGPVFIPKFLDGRNKLFFVVSFEGLRERNPQTQIYTVPTELERQGDFSQLRNAQGSAISIYDPLTTRSNGAGGYTRTPFTGNRIPNARLNPVGSRAVAYYPAPNRISESLDGLNNYFFNNSSRNSYDQWLGKLDWSITDRHRVSGRYAQTPWYNYAQVVWGTNEAEPSGEFPSTRITRNWGYDYTWTMSQTTVFNLRAGLARYEGFSGNEFGRNYDPRQLGFPDALVNQFTSLQFPRFNLSGNNYAPLGATRTSGYETRDTYSLQPSLQSIVGTHSLKYGAEFRLYNFNNRQPGAASGNYTMDTVWTRSDPQRADALSGNSMASFLLGYATSGNVERNVDLAYQNPYYVFYLQDDWKIRRNLTINLGFRWDYESPISERYNRQVRGFAFDSPSPLQAQVPNLTLNGGLLFAGDSGENRLAFDRSFRNFQPRVGVAWSASDKWVVRGGYGLFFLGQNATGPSTGFSRPTALVASTDNGLTPAANLSDPFPQSLFPTGLLQPIGSSLGLATNQGLNISAQYLDRPLPYSQQFSVGFQRLLPWQWVADVSYVGNLTNRLPVNANLNFIPLAELERFPVAQRSAYFNERISNPMAGMLPGSAINGATVPRQQLLYAYPQFSQVEITNVPIGRQSYHSLQMKGTRRYRAGLAIQASYTWSKTLEKVSVLNAQDVNLQDLTKTALEQRLAEYDMPHTFSAVASYELPFGKGRKFFNGPSGLMNAIFGGWNLSAQYMIRSGQPLEFPNAAPMEARSAKLNSEQRDALARQAGYPEFNPLFTKWFDTSLFPSQAQAPFTLRNFPTRFPDVRSPHMESWELSGYKEFNIAEKARVQLRGDFQNAFDFASFSRLAVRPNNVTNSRFGLLDPEQGNSPRMVAIVLKVIF